MQVLEKSVVDHTFISRLAKMQNLIYDAVQISHVTIDLSKYKSFFTKESGRLTMIYGVTFRNAEVVIGEYPQSIAPRLVKLLITHGYYEQL